MKPVIGQPIMLMNPSGGIQGKIPVLSSNIQMVPTNQPILRPNVKILPSQSSIPGCPRMPQSISSPVPLVTPGSRRIYTQTFFHGDAKLVKTGMEKLTRHINSITKSKAMAEANSGFLYDFQSRVTKCYVIP